MVWLAAPGLVMKRLINLGADQLKQEARKPGTNSGGGHDGLFWFFLASWFPAYPGLASWRLIFQAFFNEARRGIVKARSTPI
jgi:hypothetical protein